MKTSDSSILIKIKLVRQLPRTAFIVPEQKSFPICIKQGGFKLASEKPDGLDWLDDECNLGEYGNPNDGQG